jgi:hypothetical protein
MTRKGWSFLAGGIAAACIVLLAVAVIVDRRISPPAQAAENGSDYGQQMTALDTAYKQGVMARKKMLAHKVAPSGARCVAMYRATAASELGNAEFENEVEAFYVSGCRALKKPT